MSDSDQAHSGHGNGHGHDHDRGVAAMMRYLRHAPRMWSSAVNTAVIDLVAPTDGERVVDIGAGMGPGTVLAARAGASVVAVEPTPFMRSVLKTRRLCSRSRERITVVDGAAEQMPVDDDSIDAVWAVNSMHHWVDPERAAVEIARVLKPGGRVVLIDEDFADPDHPEHESWVSRHHGEGHGHGHDGDGDGDDHDDHDHDDHGDHDHDHDDDSHHGLEMVDATRIGDLLTAAGVTDVDADTRTLADRPVIAVIAGAPRA